MPELLGHVLNGGVRGGTSRKRPGGGVSGGYLCTWLQGCDSSGRLLDILCRGLWTRSRCQGHQGESMARRKGA
jgi:hypothetical protein